MRPSDGVTPPPCPTSPSSMPTSPDGSGNGSGARSSTTSSHTGPAGSPAAPPLASWPARPPGPPPLDPPAARPRPAVRPPRGSVEGFALPADLSRRLHALRRDASATPFMTLLAAFQVLLHRYSGQDDFAIG